MRNILLLLLVVVVVLVQLITGDSYWPSLIGNRAVKSGSPLKRTERIQHVSAARTHKAMCARQA